MLLSGSKRLSAENSQAFVIPIPRSLLLVPHYQFYQLFPPGLYDNQSEPWICGEWMVCAVFSRPKDEEQARGLKRYLCTGGIAHGVLILILLLCPVPHQREPFRPTVGSDETLPLGPQLAVENLGLYIVLGHATVISREGFFEPDARGRKCSKRYANCYPR